MQNKSLFIALLFFLAVIAGPQSSFAQLPAPASPQVEKPIQAALPAQASDGVAAIISALLGAGGISGLAAILINRKTAKVKEETAAVKEETAKVKEELDDFKRNLINIIVDSSNIVPLIKDKGKFVNRDEFEKDFPNILMRSVTPEFVNQLIAGEKFITEATLKKELALLAIQTPPPQAFSEDTLKRTFHALGKRYKKFTQPPLH